MSKRIAFFGNERLATGVGTTAPILEALIEAGYEVTAVIAAQQEATPSRKGRGLEVWAVADKHDIPFFLANSKPGAPNFIDQEKIKSFGAEAAVLVAFGQLVPQEVIDIFPRGIINIHPSLLPLHRGSIPIESVILNGEHKTGVSLMSLVAEMDAGPIYAQESLLLIGTESKKDLFHKLRQMGKDLLLEHLPAILDGSLQPQPQIGEPTYDQRIEKSDGVIDWTKPAERLEREVRAYLEWPRSRTTLGNVNVVITKAHVAEGNGQPGQIRAENKQLAVYCGENMLVIDSLIPAGKKEMTAQSFLNGYKI